MLVIAEKAVSLMRGKKQRTTSVIKTRKMIRSGVIVLGLILYQNLEKGSPPSLAIAKPILDVTVILLKPAKNMLMISMHVIDSAPPRFNKPFELVKARVYTFTTA